MNWTKFLIFGVLWQIFWVVWDFSKGNMMGARFQLILCLAYAMGLTYILLNKKGKND